MEVYEEKRIEVLASAIRAGRLEEVREVIKSYDLSKWVHPERNFFDQQIIGNTLDSLGYNMLCVAIENKQFEIAELLLDVGCDINSGKERPANTPLHCAIRINNIELVDILLIKGANVNTKIFSWRFTCGYSALHQAVDYGNKNIIKLLLHHCADINAQDKSFLTPVHIAAIRGHHKIIDLLFKKGYVDNPHETCKSPLQLASRFGHVKAVKALLANGADVNAIDKANCTSLHISSEFGKEEVVKLLLKCNVDINFKNDDGLTPLHLAARSGNPKIVLALLEAGADINIKAKSKGGDLPLAITLDEFNSWLQNSAVQGMNNPIILQLKETAKIITKHIVMMISQNLTNLCVCKENLKLISINNELSSFKNLCEVEVRKMKKTMINNTIISFFDIFTKDAQKLAKYAKNWNFIQAHKSHVFLKEFPLYASQINKQFHLGKERKTLQQMCSKFFTIFTTYELSPGCIDKISSYLSNTDLRNIIKAIH